MQDGTSQQRGRPTRGRQESSPLRLPSLRATFPREYLPNPPISAPPSDSNAATYSSASAHPLLPRATSHPRESRQRSLHNLAASLPTLVPQPPSLTPPDFQDLRRYSLGSVDFVPTINHPLRSSSVPFSPLRHPSVSSTSAPPTRRHSSPYYIPKRQPRSRSLNAPRSHQSPSIGSTSVVIAEKRFSCEFCSYSSNRRFDRDRHARNHTGERPYLCNGAPFCSETFARSDSQQRHEALCPYALGHQ